MLTNKFLCAACLVATLSTPAFADGTHGDAIYHAFRIETGLGSIDADAGFADLDLDGWMGTDEHKVWLRSEAERTNGVTEQAEFWVMYSRNIGTFWDAQIGVRHDVQPDSLLHGVIGLEGLAPYFFETKAHLFVSADDDVSARIRQENEFFITQRLILQPYVEANLFVQDVPELEIGAGLSSAEFGLQTRYEFTRSFAPYVDVKYERKFGETSSIAKNNRVDNDAVVYTIGVKLLF